MTFFARLYEVLGRTSTVRRDHDECTYPVGYTAQPRSIDGVLAEQRDEKLPVLTLTLQSVQLGRADRLPGGGPHPHERRVPSGFKERHGFQALCRGRS